RGRARKNPGRQGRRSRHIELAAQPSSDETQSLKRVSSDPPMATGRPIPSIDEAMALHRAGRLADAETIYRQILEASPDDFDSLHLLGVICSQRGRHADAIRYIDAALATRPDDISAHHNRGVALMAFARFEAALMSFDNVLARRPDHVDALGNRGKALKELR